MKDTISLIAAAAGGFMLSIAAASIIKAAPVTSLKAQPSLSSTPVAAHFAAPTGIDPTPVAPPPLLTPNS